MKPKHFDRLVWICHTCNSRVENQKALTQMLTCVSLLRLVQWTKKQNKNWHMAALWVRAFWLWTLGWALFFESPSWISFLVSITTLQVNKAEKLGSFIKHAVWNVLAVCSIIRLSHSGAVHKDRIANAMNVLIYWSSTECPKKPLQ